MSLKSSFALIVCIVISIGAANGKALNSSISEPSPGDTEPQLMEQTININNCGLRTDERKLLTDMKHKIDALYEEEFGKGKYEGLEKFRIAFVFLSFVFPFSPLVLLCFSYS